MTVLPRVALLGAEGQLGWELARSLRPVGEVIPFSRRELDLADLSVVDRVLRDARPTIICNAAAYTAVDRAESEPDLAMRVNGTAPGVIGEAAKRLGAAVIHFSTDYVFDGTSARAYRESDRPNPLNTYGRSKLAGERALAESGAAQLTIRTSWVYAMRGTNFARTILRLARERDTLRVVADQRGTPTWARWLADAVAQIAGQMTRHEGGPETALRTLGGLVHLTGDGETTWHAFAETILATDPRRDEQRAQIVEPIPTSAYPTPAVRPRRSVLDSREAERRFGLARTSWLVQLQLAMQSGGYA